MKVREGAMKVWTMFALAVTIAGCGAVATEGAKIQQENTTEEASVKRIITVETLSLIHI